MSEIAEAPERMSTPTVALVGLSLALGLSSLSNSVVNVALPSLAEAFSASFQTAQWILLANLLAMTTLIVSVGRLGDMFGRRTLLLAGLAVFTVASTICMMAPSLSVLIAARAVQGLGAAIMMALTTAFVGDIVPKAKVGSAMGLLGTASSVGTALGPSLSGMLIAGFGWRAIFGVPAILGIVTLALAVRTLPREQLETKTKHMSFDYVGTAVLASTLAAYALAMTVGRGTFGVLNGVLLLATCVGVGLFIVIETKVVTPLVKFSVFQNPAIGGGVTMSAIVMTVTMTTMVVGPFYLAVGLGLSALHVGIVLSVGPIVAALIGVPAGRWVDRFGSQRVMRMGLVALLSGCFALAGAPMMWGVVGYVVPLIVLTAGYAAFQAANNTSVMADVSLGQRGVVAGMLSLSRNLGLITGAAAMGAVFAAASGAASITTADPNEIARGMTGTFLIASALTLFALIVCVRSSRNSRTVG